MKTRCARWVGRESPPGGQNLPDRLRICRICELPQQDAHGTLAQLIDVLVNRRQVEDPGRAQAQTVESGEAISVIGIPREAVELPIQRIVLDKLDFVGVRATTGEMADVVPLIADGRIRVGDLTDNPSLQPRERNGSGEPASEALRRGDRWPNNARHQRRPRLAAASLA
jgi:hypothetical protein